MNSKEDSPPSIPFRYSTPLSLLRLRQNSYRRLRRRRTIMTTSPMSSLSSPSANGGSGDHNQFLLLRRRDTYPSILGRHNNSSPDNLSNYDDVVYFLDLALEIAAETTDLQINAQAAESSTTSSSGQRIHNNGDKSQSQDKHDQ